MAKIGVIATIIATHIQFSMGIAKILLAIKAKKTKSLLIGRNVLANVFSLTYTPQHYSSHTVIVLWCVS